MLQMLVQIAQFGNGLQPATDAYSQNSASSQDSALNNMTAMISNMLSIATVVAGIAFLFYFLLGAFGWITSEGDSGKLQKARNKMIHGAIGLVIVVTAYALIGLIGSIVGIDILNPGEALKKLIP